MGVKEFDGIFNGDDVLVPRSVDTIVHVRHNLGQFQTFKGEDLEGDRPDGSPHGTPRLENVGPKTRQPFNAKGKIQFLFFLENMFLGIGKQTISYLLGLGRSEGWNVQSPKGTVDPEM